MLKQVYSWKNPKPVTKRPQSPKTCVVPNQTMSIRTIMDRYARGMPLSQNIKNPLYYDGEFPDIKNMDLTEIAEIKRFADKQVNDIRTDLQKQEDTKKYLADKQLKDQIKDLQKQLEEQGTLARGKVPL